MASSRLPCIIRRASITSCPQDQTFQEEAHRAVHNPTSFDPNIADHSEPIPIGHPCGMSIVQDIDHNLHKVRHTLTTPNPSETSDFSPNKNTLQGSPHTHSYILPSLDTTQLSPVIVSPVNLPPPPVPSPISAPSLTNTSMPLLTTIPTPQPITPQPATIMSAANPPNMLPCMHHSALKFNNQTKSLLCFLVDFKHFANISHLTDPDCSTNSVVP